jgi:hypothetical protein
MKSAPKLFIAFSTVTAKAANFIAVSRYIFCNATTSAATAAKWW